MTCSSAGTIELAAVEPEALGAGIFHVEEALEVLGLDELLEDRLLALRREADLVVGAFDAVLDPGALLGVGDMHVLGADMAGIGALQDVEHLAKRAEFEPERAAEIDRAVVVGLGEAVGLGLELGMLAAGDEFERVELGGEMAAGAVGADQRAGAQRVARRGKRLLARSSAPCGTAGAVPRRSTGAQDGPRAPASTSSLSSPRLAKKRRHSGSSEAGPARSARKAAAR